MKSLPDLTDEPAMLLKGRQSSLWKAKGDAMEALRDAYTALQSAQWDEMPDALSRLGMAHGQLVEICNLWSGL